MVSRDGTAVVVTVVATPVVVGVKPSMLSVHTILPLESTKILQNLNEVRAILTLVNDTE